MKSEQELFELSDKMWSAFIYVEVDTIKNIVDEKAVFVHMGITLDREGEIEAAVGEHILLKKVDRKERSVRFIGETAILLTKMKLTAMVGGDEVVNPFVVTEVYTKNPDWKLASLSYTRINY